MNSIDVNFRERRKQLTANKPLPHLTFSRDDRHIFAGTAAFRITLCGGKQSVPPFPDSVARFLQGKRFAVAGVSRHAGVAANAVFKKLKACGYEVFPVNPNAQTVEGEKCYPDIASLPGNIDGVVVATHPSVSPAIVRQCRQRGIMRVWFHRSFGEGSVSEEAVRECGRLGIECIVGGCPLMFCDPVDIGHKCMRWWLQRKDRVPK